MYWEESFKGYSPWGGIQASKVLMRGAKLVSTPGHGGAMVTKLFAEKNLSFNAMKRADIYGNYYCFEEDCDWAVLYFDLFFHKRDLFTKYFLKEGVTIEKTEKTLMETLSTYYPDYLLELGIKPYEKEYKIYLKGIERDKLVKAKSPNLIVSAVSVSKGVVKVYTADKKQHYVTDVSYQQLRKNNELLLLSNCELTKFEAMA